MKMRLKWMLLMGLMMLSLVACKKSGKDNDVECFENSPTDRILNEVEASVLEYAPGKFHLAEKNVIDIKLLPCELPAEYKINQLQVIISGRSVPAVQIEPFPIPCCAEMLKLSSIRRK